MNMNKSNLILEDLPPIGEDWDVIAKHLMAVIIYDNGGINRFQPEIEAMYPIDDVDRISIAAKNFFSVHPEFFNKEDMESICDGEETENEEKYGIYPEYQGLNDALNQFFNGK